MNFLIIVHILVTLAMIASILLQKGESGGLAPTSGNALFTARGSANFLTRITAILATLFIINCIGMTILASMQSQQQAKLVNSTETNHVTQK